VEKAHCCRLFAQALGAQPAPTRDNQLICFHRNFTRCKIRDFRRSSGPATFSHLSAIVDVIELSRATAVRGSIGKKRKLSCGKYCVFIVANCRNVFGISGRLNEVTAPNHAFP
jgi:hypothetical protein